MMKEKGKRLPVGLFLLSGALIFSVFSGANALAEEQAVEFKPQNDKDPFRKPYGKDMEKKTDEATIAVPKVEKPLPSFTVQGIFWGGKFPQAIIDDQVVKVGDTIKEARIVDITREGITVSFDDKIHTITAPGIIKLESLTESPKGGKDEQK
jgi:hypothetical protein